MQCFILVMICLVVYKLSQVYFSFKSLIHFIYVVFCFTNT